MSPPRPSAPPSNAAPPQRGRPIVGVRFPSWSGFGESVMGGVVDYMHDHGLWRLVTENDSYGEMEPVRIDSSWEGAGLLLFRATEEELAQFRAAGKAVVLTSTEGSDGGYPRVVPDNEAVGARAAGHLIECGLPHYAFLARGETFYQEAEFASGIRVYPRERLIGFRNRLASIQHTPIVHYLSGRPLWEKDTWREIQDEVAGLIHGLPKPCGLFVADDSLGAVALRAADAIGVTVPDELAVIGFGNDLSYCHATLPAMSSIRYPGKEIGRLAAEMLARQFAGDPATGEVERVPPGGTVERESSDTLAIPDPAISDLVRWLRREATTTPIRVSELVEHSGLSSSTLKARFSQHLGHNPKQEITNIRIGHLKRLLRDTDLPVVTIAAQMGFPSSQELSRFFLRVSGERPGRFRERERQTLALGNTGPAVIFDLDNTLIDTEHQYFEAYRQAFAEQGGTLTEATYFTEFAGANNSAIEDCLAGEAPPGFELEVFRKRWRTCWRKRINQTAPTPRDGIRQLLADLRDRGTSIAIASSSDREDIDLCLSLAGLTIFVDTIASGDEVTRGKPDPEIFLLAAKRLSCPPSHCIVVEDSDRGMQAAQAAGMRTIMVPSHADPDAPSRLKTFITNQLREELLQLIDHNGQTP